MTPDERRPDPETGTAQTAADSRSRTSSLLLRGNGAEWRNADLVRLHTDLGLHVFPTGTRKMPRGKWHLGAVDYVQVKPTDDELLDWSRTRPEGWCVLCGGPAAVLCLDIEAAGVTDTTSQGTRIRKVLSQLPDYCKRPSPGGGQHAWLRVTDGPAPRGKGGKLVQKLEVFDREGKPRYKLLAEYRGHLQYALILGHGRGDLPENFRPYEVTTNELNDILGSLREVSDKKYPIRRRPARITAGSPVHGTSTMTEAVWELDLDLLPPGPPCRAMQAQVDVITKAMANGSRHDAILGPVLQLVRLGAQRHQALVESLQSLKSVYVTLVGPDRDGGIDEAEREWSRAIAGALEIVFPSGIALGPDAVCDCWLSDYRASMRQDELFAKQGRALVTDRAVLSCLLEKARLNKSRRVRESQRQMAEHLDIQHRTVSKSLRRLEGRGWITRTSASGPGAIDTTTLVLPQGAVSTPTELPTGEGTSVGVLTDSPVHRLFGPAGLGPGAAETFAALPEWQQATGRGFLVRVAPGSQGSELLLDPSKGPRRIPAPTKGHGLTASQLAERTGKAKGTVRLHLKNLLSRGMAFQDKDGLWWRYRFDPNQLADRDEIPDTAQRKAEAHIRERRSYYRGQILFDRVRGRTPRVQLVDGSDGDRYVNPRTGEVCWIDTDPPEANPDRPSGT